MKISWKCMTYGRVHTLQELLYSFLIQEYDNDIELVIVNDYPKQKLVFDHPNVRIFNLDKTFDTIGDKENFTIENCKHSIIAVTDDDDIALKNHCSNIKKFWKEDTNLLHWHIGVYYNYPSITKIMGLGNSGIVFSKEIWEKVGKSPIQNAGGDTTFVNSIHPLGGVVFASPPDNEASWFYRWSLPGGPGVYHQSGLGHDTPDRDNVILRNAVYIEQKRREGLIPTGTIELKPKWSQDYQLLLDNYIKK